jgi:hypothetical protein
LTIATCYVSPEGVVLGADSTTTYGTNHFNNSQKLFEIGEDSTLAAVTWGLGGLQVSSHRTLLAILADDLRITPPSSVQDVANRWTDQFWAAYSDPACPMAPFITRCQLLGQKPAFDPAANPATPNARTKDEDQEFNNLRNGLVVGFCIAGYVLPDRAPAAFEILFDPLQGKPTPQQKPQGYWFWGAPNMILRLLFGCDDELKNSIMTSGMWSGTRADLDALVGKHALAHPIVPIRDAIDFVHTCIVSTIKAFKFSNLSQICGGPVEIGVITTDRNFRWVRHKTWDAAISEGAP